MDDMTAGSANSSNSELRELSANGLGDGWMECNVAYLSKYIIYIIVYT